MKLWKTYPMGGAAAELMAMRGQSAYLAHAVNEPCNEQAEALCGVKTRSLCMDESLATSDMPDCPRCARIIKRAQR